MKEGNASPTAARNKSISFRLTKSVSSSRLKGMEESDSPAKNENPKLHSSASCCVLPGMNNYSSASDDEEGNGDKRSPCGDEEILRGTPTPIPEVQTGRQHSLNIFWSDVDVSHRFTIKFGI